jgi:CubicO group peptidase (beta-lactamase class C family)
MTDTSAAVGPELPARLAGVVVTNRLSGAVAGVVHGDELTWSAATGLADVTADQPVELGTLFRIASITKPFTGTAIMQLRDAGVLDLDDPAVRWLPGLRNAVSGLAPIETVTIRRMLSHESGLPTWATWPAGSFSSSAPTGTVNGPTVSSPLPPCGRCTALLPGRRRMDPGVGYLLVRAAGRGYGVDHA